MKQHLLLLHQQVEEVDQQMFKMLEQTKKYLKENPEVLAEIEKKVREKVAAAEE